MTLQQNPPRSVRNRLGVAGLIGLLAMLGVCALSPPADAAGGRSRSRGSSDEIVVEPQPLFDENELRALVEKPSIVSFVADKTTINTGQEARLTWRVENANRVRITGFSQNWPKAGSVKVKPTEKTTYTLSASNAVGSVTKAVTVNMSNIAIIEHVTVVQPRIPTVMVTTLENVAYDFVAQAKGAQWESGQRLSFGGSSGSKGWVRVLDNVRAEDNKNYAKVLQVQPAIKRRGFINGQYRLRIPPKAKFMATVGFTVNHGSSDGATASVLVFGRPKGERVTKWRPLVAQTIKRDGKLDTMEADLSKYANQTVYIRLTVNGLTNCKDDLVLWIRPRILK